MKKVAIANLLSKFSAKIITAHFYAGTFFLMSLKRKSDRIS
jgi:hypothetical protein